MISIKYVADLIAEARGAIMVLMQEPDEGGDLSAWAAAVYDAYEEMGRALDSILEAEVYGSP